MSNICNNISKMYICHCNPLEVNGIVRPKCQDGQLSELTVLILWPLGVPVHVGHKSGRTQNTW